MEDCLFCKLVKGEIPSKKIYEDEYVLAFLDIEPVSEGHTLVIPKKHFPTVFDIDKETLQKVAVGVKKVTEILKEKLDVDACNLFQSNGEKAEQDVPHFHIHVIPRREGDKIKFWKYLEEPKNETKQLDLDETHRKIAE